MKVFTAATTFFGAVAASAIPTSIEQADHSSTLVKRVDLPKFSWAEKSWAQCLLNADIQKIANEYRPILHQPNVKSLFYTAGTDGFIQAFKAQYSRPDAQYVTLLDVWARPQVKYGRSWFINCWLHSLGKPDSKYDDVKKAWNELASAAFAGVSRGDVAVVVPSNWEPFKNGPQGRGVWIRVEFPSLDRTVVTSVKGYKVLANLPGAFRQFNIHLLGDGQKPYPKSS